ncbi:hypothetical protein LCGC14_3007870 [marine sediment metagenome]|uniref:Uncharacterized protein n=1 Tax=marine sediment metagenome TaxID=412755 RepID=A0A0F8WZJ9_9ZZZZ
MKILNIYGQEFWHTDARIVGNREGLEELRDTIERALKDGKSSTLEDDARSGEETPLFASDGEGYEVIVLMNNDDWGIKGGKDSFWNTEESRNEYTGISKKGK